MNTLSLLRFALSYKVSKMTLSWVLDEIYDSVSRKLKTLLLLKNFLITQIRLKAKVTLPKLN